MRVKPIVRRCINWGIAAAIGASVSTCNNVPESRPPGALGSATWKICLQEPNSPETRASLIGSLLNFSKFSGTSNFEKYVGDKQEFHPHIEAILNELGITRNSFPGEIAEATKDEFNTKVEEAFTGIKSTGKMPTICNDEKLKLDRQKSPSFGHFM